MVRKMTQQALGAVAAAALVAACSTSVSEPSDDPETAITQQATVSDCGGFARATDAGDAPTYCEAEVLYWSYEAATQKLTLNNTRIELNCCGEHDMAIDRVGDEYVVTETDAPEDLGLGEGARCSCMCVFDFALAAEGMAEEPIALRLVRNVTDGSGAETVFEGTLDLGAGSGFEILDPTPSMWCELDSSSDDAPSAS